MTGKRTTKQSDFSKYIKRFWRIVILGVFLVIAPFFLASVGALGVMPTFEDLENPENNLATEVISSDGKTLGKYAYENRTPVKYKDIPQNLVEALVATEDERFYEHSGIDFKATSRAILKFGKKGGGSTITQQLSRLLFIGDGSKNSVERIFQKIKEYVIAIRLERQYTKQEILAMYLNKYDFLNQAVGIRSASRIYFGKEPKELIQEESAMLVGMLKNSSLYNPIRRPERVKNRRNVVLKQMEKNEFITTQLKDSLQKRDLGLDLHREGHSDGYATYFREYLRNFMKKWIKEHPKPEGGKYNLHRDGLKIFVTLNQSALSR